MQDIVIVRDTIAHRGNSAMLVKASREVNLSMLMIGLRAIGFDIEAVRSPGAPNLGKVTPVATMPGQIEFIERIGRNFCNPEGCHYDDSKNKDALEDLNNAIEHAKYVADYDADPDSYDEPPRSLDYYVSDYTQR